MLSVGMFLIARLEIRNQLLETGKGGVYLVETRA